MRGLVLVGPRPPPTGGVATHVRELQRAVEAQGVPVDLIDPRRQGPDGRDGRPRFAARMLAAAARNELVHVHTNGHNRMSWMVALAASTGASVGRPCLVTLHSGLAPAFMRAHPRLVRSIARRFSTVVAVNDEIAAALADVGVERGRVVVAPAFSASSLSFRLPPPGLRTIRQRHPLLIASAVVHGAREYGEDVLLDAFVRVHQSNDAAALLVYGPGTQSATFVAEVKRRGLAGSVYCMGELERERALALVAAADVFVRPTRADGDAISVREALALGRPVVASNVGCRPAEAVLFPSEDWWQLAENIFRVVGNRTTPLRPETASHPDSLPRLLAIYARHGLAVSTATTGTLLATDVA